MNGEDRSAMLQLLTKQAADQRASAIVAAAQARSPEAFAEIYALYSQRLYKTIIGITRNTADAEDALQETFFRAYSAIHTFEGRSKLCSWLTRIAINSALMILRRRHARAEILFDSVPDARGELCSFEIKDHAPDPEQAYDLRQCRASLLDAICSLDDQLRIPLQMQMTKGSPVKEIGRALNLSEAAVKTRLHRARRQVSMHVRARDGQMGMPSMVAPRRNAHLI